MYNIIPLRISYLKPTKTTPDQLSGSNTNTAFASQNPIRKEGC
jgi:hypothetical protein